ncbi:hypothetical protein F8O01_15670 [Pseudoclavibacter chungangensis]|uniref:Tetratricopeptide repeat protein n=1 Tax=Pseudoclavibacter chungangensis TaxID=587635 RepID=A0A7J5BN57_9MICO|nr:hypothetical protein [Pseudoclavibacter chungangensis]KAB1653100.1 hypothetical protein F8O01_15670 [Pseudoclavibacter chungangensis]NYJ67012.1 tetratricopeptide (TPR) repeat protein [Pseudoclavibacter chungangensis]
MRSLNSPDDAFFRRASALRSDGTDGAPLEIILGGDVAVPSGALYLGPVDGTNGVDGVVVRVPADIYRVLVTIRPGDAAGPPLVRAITVELTGDAEASQSGLPANAFWHESPGVVPVLDTGDGLFVAADAGLRDQHRDGRFPWDGWIRDAVQPALQDARLAGRHSTEVSFPGRQETIVALMFDRDGHGAPVEVAMYAGFDERGMPAKLHVAAFDGAADGASGGAGTPRHDASPFGAAPQAHPGRIGAPPQGDEPPASSTAPWDATPVGVPPAQGLTIPTTPFSAGIPGTIGTADGAAGGTVPDLVVGDAASGRSPFGGPQPPTSQAPEAPVFGASTPPAPTFGGGSAFGSASSSGGSGAPPIGPVFGGAAADMDGAGDRGASHQPEPRRQHDARGAVGSFFADDDVPSWADPSRDEHRPARTFDDVISASASSAWDASGSTDQGLLWDDAARDRAAHDHGPSATGPREHTNVPPGSSPALAQAAPTREHPHAPSHEGVPAPSVMGAAPGQQPGPGAAPEFAPFASDDVEPAQQGTDRPPQQGAPAHVVPASDPAVSGPLIRALDEGLAAVDRNDAAAAVPQLGTVLVGLECGAGEFPDVATALSQRDLTAPQLVDLVVDLQLREGQTGDAVESLRRALSSRALSGTLAETVHLRKRLGELQIRSGDEADAVSTLEAAEGEASALLRDADAEQRADTVGYARDYHAHITFLLADSSLRLGDPTRAVQLAGDAMRAFEQLGLDRMAGRAAFLAASANGRLGNDAGRLASIRDAERVFRRGGELDGLGTALGFLGEDDALRGDYRAAVATFIEARSVLERAGEFTNAATAAHNLSICLRRLGDDGGADDATREAERLELRAASDRDA